MFRFGEPVYLYLLIILPILVGLYLYSNYRRRKKIAQYGDPELLAHLMPDVSKYRPDVSSGSFLLHWLWLFLCWPVLKFGSKMETVKRQGVETVVALDISNSMLAQDVTPSRLEKSKKLISRLVETFNNDKVAMIVFAGELLPSCLSQAIIFLPKCFWKPLILHLSQHKELISPEPLIWL